MLVRFRLLQSEGFRSFAVIGILSSSIREDGTEFVAANACITPRRIKLISSRGMRDEAL
jgi:hypothetical protein